MTDLDCSTQCVCPFVITDDTGVILARFSDEWERNEALLTGEYPDDAEPAYENPPGVPDCGDPGPECAEHDGECD